MVGIVSLSHFITVSLSDHHVRECDHLVVDHLCAPPLCRPPVSSHSNTLSSHQEMLRWSQISNNETKLTITTITVTQYLNMSIDLRVEPKHPFEWFWYAFVPRLWMHWAISAIKINSPRLYQDCECLSEQWNEARGQHCGHPCCQFLLRCHNYRWYLRYVPTLPHSCALGYSGPGTGLTFLSCRVFHALIVSISKLS